VIALFESVSKLDEMGFEVAGLKNTKSKEEV